ncbi:MAG: type II toxin-antitoxin system HicA family toxin [Sulfuricaulis sp.]
MNSFAEYKNMPRRTISPANGIPTWEKGSHGVLILGDRRTVVRNPKDELKTGTLHAMLKQLGLSRNDI